MEGFWVFRVGLMAQCLRNMFISPHIRPCRHQTKFHAEVKTRTGTLKHKTLCSPIDLVMRPLHNPYGGCWGLKV